MSWVVYVVLVLVCWFACVGVYGIGVKFWYVYVVLGGVVLGYMWYLYRCVGMCSECFVLVCVLLCGMG